MNSPKESDWKTFSGLIPQLRERYLAARNLRITQVLSDSGKTETKRFWEAMEAMEKEAKILRSCLDGHSRSRMWMYLISMIQCGMLTREDFAKFSPELQSEFDYVFKGKKPETVRSICGTHDDMRPLA